MAQAGATQEEIEEMMVLLLSQGTGVSPDFIDAVKDAMQFGGKLPSYNFTIKLPLAFALFLFVCLFVCLNGPQILDPVVGRPLVGFSLKPKGLTCL